MADVFEQHPEMTVELTDFAFVLPKTQGAVKSLVRQPFRGNMIKSVARSWAYAVQKGAVASFEDHVVFQVFGAIDEDATLGVTIKPNPKPGGHPYIVVMPTDDELAELGRVAVADDMPEPVAPAQQAAPAPQQTEPVSAPVEPAVAPSPQPASAASSQRSGGARRTNAKDLRDYAFIWVGKSDGRHVNALEEIASRALPETWGFGEGDYTILYNYIVQTFYKLRQDGLVLETADRTFAAMNSGLVTPWYDDLYLCFKPNPVVGARQPWSYAGVCTQLDNRNKRLSAELRAAFPDMPERARFFKNVSDIVFDASKEIICNWEHIIIENVDRIPTDFIAHQLYGRPAAHIRALVESIDYDPDQGSAGNPFGDHATGEAKEKFDELRDFLSSSPTHFNRIQDAMEGALDRAIKRAQYSFRTGVPSFYPTINKIQILLPLCLMDEDQPDCALVTAKDDWGNYEGRTILTLRMAYNNARLLCRPESEWLSV